MDILLNYYYENWCFKILYDWQSLIWKVSFQIVNLLAIDSQRIFEAVVIGPLMLPGPIVLLMGLVYMLVLIGPWSLVAMGVYGAFYPFMVSISMLFCHRPFPYVIFELFCQRNWKRFLEIRCISLKESSQKDIDENIELSIVGGKEMWHLFASCVQTNIEGQVGCIESSVWNYIVMSLVIKISRTRWRGAIVQG